VNINLIKQWIGDMFLVSCNDSRGTCIGFLGVQNPTAWAGIHGDNKTATSLILVFNNQTKLDQESFSFKN
jgi:hypothetical protein